MTDKKKNTLIPLEEIEDALKKDGKTLQDLIDQTAESEKQRPFESYRPGTNPLTDADRDTGDTDPTLDGHDLG